MTHNTGNQSETAVIKLTFSSCKVHVYRQSDKPSPLVYLPTFEHEGEQVWQQCLKMQTRRFTLAAISDFSWDDDLTPWPMAVTADNQHGYAGKGEAWLRKLTEEIMPEVERRVESSCRILAGYSLAGLFALWAAHQSDLFSGVVSCSGSVWYPHFEDFTSAHKLSPSVKALYLSLGDKEQDSRPPVLAHVQDITERLAAHYQRLGLPTIFQLNNGGHYNQPEWRVAKGLQWMLRQIAR